MTSEDKSPVKPEGCAGKKGAFFASVALNLFLLGVVVAPFVGGRAFAPPPPPPLGASGFGPPRMGALRAGGPGFMVERMARALPEADAAKLRAIYAEAADHMKVKHETGRETFQKIAEILRQDNPDVAALDAAFDALRTEGQQVHADMSAALKRVATELPPESRRKIADFIAEGPMMGPRGMRGGMRPLPPLEQGAKTSRDPMPPPDAPVPPDDPAAPTE